MQKGLESRWDITDNADYVTDDEMKETLGSAVKAELDSVEKYKDEKFEDSALQELVLKYINTLKAQEESLDYVSADPDKFNTDWQSAYEERTQMIDTFYNDYDLKVSEKYESDLEELLTKSKLVTEEANTKETIEKWIDSFAFTEVSDEYGFKTYEAVVENTTGVDFDYISLSINLIDAEGVTLETTYASIDNVTNGAKVKFEFTTDAEFSSTEITPDYALKQ